MFAKYANGGRKMSDLIAPLIVNKMTEKYADLFTPEALSALEILKTDKSHIVADNNEILGLTFFVGQVFAHQKGFLAEEIIGAFNDLVSKGMVKGVLCPLSSVELDPIDLDKKEAYFSFCSYR